MRFGEKFNDSIMGSQRVIRKFLWFPLEIDNQIRWLEIAKIRQICKYHGEEFGYAWENYEWVDDDEIQY